MIEIITDRLIIRDHINDDLLNLHRLISDDEIMFYLPEIKTATIEESRENLATSINESQNPDRSKFYFAVIDKVSGEYIGEIGICKVNECDEGNVMNLGYFILKEYWGRGIIPEASKAVIDYAFKYLNTIKIETGCVKLNSKSEKVMTKIGLIKEAELLKHSVINKKFYDRVEYRILKEEWI